MKVKSIIVFTVQTAVLCSGLWGYATTLPADLTSLSLEELMTVQVISASKKSEDFFKTPAAVFVISQQDIRRSGATTIPEILRMVPGVQVARIDGNKWAVTARGFNSHFADKLLVLMDGRTLFSPIHAGVYWDVQDTMLEDIDRIEVIRGPGATLWGANAVNGVINIITKKAGDTQGGLAVAGAGTEEKIFSSLRFGGRMGETVDYRVYGKFFYRDNMVSSSGEDTADDWNQARSGFRVDWNKDIKNNFTLQGDIYKGKSGQTRDIVLLHPPYSRTVTEDVDVDGANLLGRWQHSFSRKSQMELQLYYDHSARDHLTLDERLDIIDLDFHHHFSPWSSHSLVWGLGYRHVFDKLIGSYTLSFEPEELDYYRANFFLQDDITLVPDRLHLIIGSKFEDGDFFDMAIQPNARLLWTVNERNTLWSAVSKTVRTTSRGDRDIRIILAAFPGSDSALNLLTLLGNDTTISKDVTALEAGYRMRPLDRLFFDFAVYCNIYDNLRSVESGTPYFNESGNQVIPLFLSNKRTGTTYGLEIASKWQVNGSWQLSAGYNWYNIDIDLDPESTDTTETGNYEEDQPEHQFNVHSHLDLSADWEFDTSLYYVDKLNALAIDDYVRMDLRLGWHPLQPLDVSFVITNLLDDQHQEYISTDGIIATEIERSFYTRLTYRF